MAAGGETTNFSKRNAAGQLHCVGEPAQVWYGDTYWCFKGKYHCLTGPAHIVHVNNERLGWSYHYIDNERVMVRDFEDAVIDYCNKNPECPTVVHLMTRDTPEHVLDYCDAHPESAAAAAYRRNNSSRNIKPASSTSLE